MNTTDRKPTADDVRIDGDGRVEYRKEGDDMWLEGCWVSEYRFDDEVEGGVILA